LNKLKENDLVVLNLDYDIEMKGYTWWDECKGMVMTVQKIHGSGGCSLIENHYTWRIKWLEKVGTLDLNFIKEEEMKI
jgi:hypothetical protein